MRKQQTFQFGLNSDYLKSEIISNTTNLNLVSLIQFINYARDLDFELQYLEDVSYRKVTLKILRLN